ncbi:MAG TPA: isochorismatase family protein [Woeseiaceae bacterium]|nr:isochorismatase family protein [Woeseiaceae bacterium]
MSQNLSDNYRKAYGNRLGFGERPALILVDFVQAYFDPDCELYANVEAQLESALRIRDAARSARIPVIYTRVAYQQGGMDGGLFFKKVLPLKHFVAGGELGNWAKGIDPIDGELVIVKQYPSAFFGTSLSSALTTMGTDTLVITGLTTSGCVRATCVDAISLGFIPIVVADACGDRHESPHTANLFDMNAKYGDVVDEQEVVSYLSGLHPSRKLGNLQ